MELTHAIIFHSDHSSLADARVCYGQVKKLRWDDDDSIVKHKLATMAEETCLQSLQFVLYIKVVLEGSVSSNQKCLALSKADLPSSEHHGKMKLSQIFATNSIYTHMIQCGIV
ncbi:hypothetical protein EMCRGX_G007562 [Ephydatia muelleri]